MYFFLLIYVAVECNLCGYNTTAQCFLLFLYILFSKEVVQLKLQKKKKIEVHSVTSDVLYYYCCIKVVLAVPLDGKGARY